MEPPFDTPAYSNYLETVKPLIISMKPSSFPYNHQKHYDLKDRQKLCKDLEHLCREDPTILEVIIDEYVYLLKDKRVEEMIEFVKKEMESDL